ncbi:MAG: O-antigen ligase family protein [Victivallaceae bacterium]|nr:O-antigen ligase family protein [Victivallaceae bacterium]
MNTVSSKCLPAVVFFAAMLLAYPLRWSLLTGTPSPMWSFYRLFGWGELGLLAAALLATRGRVALPDGGKVMKIAFGGFCAALMIQAFAGFFSPPDLFAGGAWVSVALLACAMAKGAPGDFRRLLGWVCCVLTVTSLLYYALEFSTIRTGVTGNWNWSAIALAMAAPGCFLLRERDGSPILPALAAIIAILVASASAPFSRGAAISVFLGGGCAAIFAMPPKYRLPAAGVFLLGSAALLGAFAGAYSFRTDSRVYLWPGAVSVFLDHPLGGCGVLQYESAAAPYVPIGYYLTDFPAARHLHCHNQLLQWLATMGMGGLACAVLYFTVFAAFVRRLWRRSKNSIWALYLLFVFVALGAHGMIDPVLESWPMGGLFCASAGAMAAYAFPAKQVRFSPLWSIPCWLLMGLLLWNAHSYSLHYRSGRIRLAQQNFPGALESFDRATRTVFPGAEAFYAAGRTALFGLRQPAKALEYLEAMPRKTNFVNFEHNHALAARSLTALGRFEESLAHYEAEQQNFRFGALNCFFHSKVLALLGREEAARHKRAQCRELLAAKGLSEKDLPLLMRNEEYDLNRNLIPAEHRK